MGIEIGDNDVFVGLPRAAHDEREAIGCKSLDEWERMSRGEDVGHAVEARVAVYLHVVDANGGEQVERWLVLHEDGGVALEHLAEHSAPRLEKRLCRSEYRRDDV